MIASRVARTDDAVMTAEQELIAESEDGAEEYLLTSWFYRAMEAIRETRITNNLTQEAVARALGTSQSVVARIENSHVGNFSLDRFLRYAWACGAAPLDFEQVSPHVLRGIALRDLQAPRTANNARFVRLADALNLGQLTMDAAWTREPTGDESVTFTVSIKAPTGEASGNATAGWDGPGQTICTDRPIPGGNGDASLSRSVLQAERQHDNARALHQRPAA